MLERSPAPAGLRRFRGPLDRVSSLAGRDALHASSSALSLQRTRASRPRRTTVRGRGGRNSHRPARGAWLPLRFRAVRGQVDRRVRTGLAPGAVDISGRAPEVRCGCLWSRFARRSTAKAVSRRGSRAKVGDRAEARDAGCFSLSQSSPERGQVHFDNDDVPRPDARPQRKSGGVVRRRGCAEAEGRMPVAAANELDRTSLTTERASLPLHAHGGAATQPPGARAYES